MDKVIIVLMGIIIVITFCTVLFYTKWKEKWIGSIHVFLFITILIIFITAINLIGNAIPYYQTNPLVFDGEYEVIENTTLPMNQNLTFYDRAFYTDMAFIGDKQSAVAYTNKGLGCTVDFNEACDRELQLTSFVERYNAIGDVEWRIELNSILSEDGFDGYQFDARSVTIRNDELTVLFGIAMDTETHITSNAILIISEDGIVEDLFPVDALENYYDGMMYYANYDIVATDDGGVTIQYVVHHQDTVLIHYDAAFNQIWDYVLEESNQTTYIDFDAYDYFETLQYDGGVHTILSGNMVYGINNDGELLWNLGYQQNITSFDITRGMLVVGVAEQETLFDTTFTSISEYGHSIYASKAFVIDLYQGTVLNELILKTDHTPGAFSYTTYYDFFFRHVIQDDNGYYYAISYVRNRYPISSDYTYHMLITKFNNSGEQIGYDVVEGDLENSINRSYCSDRLYQSYVYLEVDQLEFFTPYIDIHRSINLSELEFNQEPMVDFEVEDYNTINEYKVAFNVALIYIYIGFGSVASVYIIQKLIKDNRYDYE